MSLTTAAAAAPWLVLNFAGRCFLLFEFAAGEMMKDCISSPWHGGQRHSADYNSIAETENIPTAS